MGIGVARKLRQTSTIPEVKLWQKHVGRLTTLFERVRTLISIGVFNSWHQLYTFIGDPASRPPPAEMGWLIG